MHTGLYYYSRNGAEVLGPIEERRLLEMIRSGQLPPGTLVCGEGRKDWHPLSAVLQDGYASEAQTKGSKISKREMVLLGVLVAGILFLFFGKVHIISGGNLSAPKVVAKDVFGFDETFINMDQITGMPWNSARARFPIGCSVLLREQLIESDEDFKQRVRGEIRNEVRDGIKWWSDK